MPDFGESFSLIGLYRSEHYHNQNMQKCTEEHSHTHTQTQELLLFFVSSILDSLVEIHVRKLFRWLLRDGHFVIVEDGPLGGGGRFRPFIVLIVRHLFLDVRHVVAAEGRCAHVAHKGYQLVPANTVTESLLLRG